MSETLTPVAEVRPLAIIPPVGPERDLAVATEVMGWKVYPWDDCREGWSYNSYLTQNSSTYRPSTEHRLAWEMFEKMQYDGWRYTLKDGRRVDSEHLSHAGHFCQFHKSCHRRRLDLVKHLLRQ